MSSGSEPGAIVALGPQAKRTKDDLLSLLSQWLAEVSAEAARTALRQAVSADAVDLEEPPS